MVDKRVQFWCSLLNAHYIPSVFIPPSCFFCLIALILYGMSDVLGRMYFPTYGSYCVVWIYEWTIHPMGTDTAISISEVCKMKDSEPKGCLEYSVYKIVQICKLAVFNVLYCLPAGASYNLLPIACFLQRASYSFMWMV